MGAPLFPNKLQSTLFQRRHNGCRTKRNHSRVRENPRIVLGQASAKKNVCNIIAMRKEHNKWWQIGAKEKKVFRGGKKMSVCSNSLVSWWGKRFSPRNTQFRAMQNFVQDPYYYLVFHFSSKSKASQASKSLEKCIGPHHHYMHIMSTSIINFVVKLRNTFHFYEILANAAPPRPRIVLENKFRLSWILVTNNFCLLSI